MAEPQLARAFPMRSAVCSAVGGCSWLVVVVVLLLPLPSAAATSGAASAAGMSSIAPTMTKASSTPTPRMIKMAMLQLSLYSTPRAAPAPNAASVASRTEKTAEPARAGE